MNTINKIIPGLIYKCQLNDTTMYSYWIAPVDKNDKYHLENMLINIVTGEIKHFSHLKIISSGSYESYFGD